MIERWRHTALAAGFVVVLLLAIAATITPSFGDARADTLDLRVLLITTGTAEQDAGFALMDDLLDELGVHYDVLNSAETVLDEALLFSGGHGFYNGIIVTVTDTYMPGTGGPGLSATEWGILHRYERDFGVKEAVLGGWPGAGRIPNYGVTDVESEPVVEARWTDAGADGVFAYINTENTLQLADLSFSAVPRGLLGDPIVTPYLVDDAAPERALVSHLQYDDGREVLLSTVTNAWFLGHSQLLAYGFLDFATSGLHLGARQLHLTTHIDDLFLPAALWDSASNTAISTEPYRTSAADLTNIADSQDALAAAHPTAQNFLVELAFNGYGAATTPGGDALTDAVVANRDRLRFLNHTYSHRDMDVSAGTTAALAADEIARNRTTWIALGLPDAAANRNTVVTGSHSGLLDDSGTPWDPSDDVQYPAGLNSDVIAGFENVGIEFMAADASRVGQAVEQFVPGSSILLLPRYPTGIFFDVVTPEQMTDQYNYVFHERYVETGQDPCAIPAAICRPRTYEQILDAEAAAALQHMLTHNRWPHFFHVANMVDYDGEGSTLLFDWLEAVVSAYEDRLDLPIVNLPFHEIGALTADSVAAKSMEITATVTIKTGQVSLSAPNGVAMKVTGLVGGTPYGDQLLLDVELSLTPKIFEVAPQRGSR